MDTSCLFDSLENCVDLELLRKVVEYLNVSQDDVKDILLQRSASDLHDLHHQSGRSSPPELGSVGIVYDLCSDISPTPTRSFNLQDFPIYKMPVELVLPLLEVKFWRSFSSMPFGELIRIADMRATASLLPMELRHYLSTLSLYVCEQGFSELFSWFMRSSISPMRVESPLDHVRQFCKGISRSDRDVQDSLYLLDTLKWRVQRACRERTNSSWKRIRGPVLQLRAERIRYIADELTQQHTRMLVGLSQSDIFERSQPFVHSCEAWDKLAEAAREAVTFRPENVRLLLSLIDLCAVKMNIFAVVALLQGVPDRDQRYRGFHSATEQYPYRQLLGSDKPILLHLTPFRTYEYMRYPLYVQRALSMISKHSKKQEQDEEMALQLITQTDELLLMVSL